MRSASRLKWRYCLVLSPLAFLSGCGGGGSPSSTTPLVKIACVGDSITSGQGLPDRTNDCYPAQLGRKLGRSYDVRNFGASGSTLLNGGTRPYQSLQAFTQALQFQPDIVIVQLGTNDSKLELDAQVTAHFEADYQTLINAFKSKNPSVKVYACLPVPSYPLTRRSNIIMSRNVVPAIRNVAGQTGATVIDLNTPFTGTGDQYSRLYMDAYHPNTEGARLLATTIYNSLQVASPVN